MRRISTVWFRTGMAALLACGLGCSSSTMTTGTASSANGAGSAAAARAVEEVGGAAWNDVQRVEATVLLDVRPVDGKAYVNRFDMNLILGAGQLGEELKAEAPTPNGLMKIDVLRGGAVEGLSAGETPENAATAAFSVLLKRLAGPFNLLAPGVKLGAETPYHLPGEQLIRVPVEGDGIRKAYYFRTSDGLLRYVTAGADKPGEKGTVTVYDYAAIGGGMKYPSRIRIVRIGENVLVSDDEILSAELSDVQTRSTME